MGSWMKGYEVGYGLGAPGWDGRGVVDAERSGEREMSRVACVGRHLMEMERMSNEIRLVVGLIILLWQLESWTSATYFLVDILWGDKQ